MSEDFSKLPDNLPEPEGDGKYDHLIGTSIPVFNFPSTGETIDSSKINSDYLILYFFPMMKMSGKELPKGWNDIPGARGCTPQNIMISEHEKDFQNLNATIIGVSTQSIDELKQLSSLRKFSQPLISDNRLYFQEKLDLPTFNAGDKIMYKRLTLIIKKSKIVKVLYPVFPPDRHVFEILKWIENEVNQSP